MKKKEDVGVISRYLSVFQYTSRAAKLVWDTSPWLTIVLALLTVIGGVVPPTMAWVGKELIDSVLLAIETKETNNVVYWIALEASLVFVFTAFQRASGVCETLLRSQLSNRVNLMILEKAVSLDLLHFEDSEFYDKMTRARRQASVRPLSLIKRTFRLIQNSISLVSYGIILLNFSGFAVLILMMAAIPSFLAENKFAQEGFQIFRWQSKAKREQMYLETVVARDDFAKEVILLGIGPRLVQKYGDIFTKLYKEDQNLIIKRGLWGFGLGTLSMAALYGAYFWIAFAAVASTITLGTMTMYFVAFKQGQQAFGTILQSIGGMYEDNLYVSNLYEFLEQKVEKTKIVTNEEIQNALLILDNAKQQNTYQSLDDSFFK